jgi:hypothetical protein
MKGLFRVVPKSWRIISIAFILLPSAFAAPISIQVIEGQNAINNIRRNTAFEPVVEIQNAEGKPITGASVTFSLPSVGPGASFADGAKTLMVQTDASGRAAARGLHPNSQTGQFEIRVNASFEGETASATITQTNAAPAVVSSSGSGKKWAILLGVIGGGAAAAAVAASGGGKTTAAAAQPSGTGTPAAAGTVTPGAPGFGPPR